MLQKATAASWQTKPMPATQKELALSGSYSAAEYEQINLGFIPRDQQDKWFIYLEGEWLHFHRSWTGSCIFQLHIRPVDDHFEADKAIVNRDPAQYWNTDDQQDVNLISHLIDDLLLDRFSIFPNMSNLSAADQQRHQQHVMGKRAPDGLRLQVNNGKT